MLLTLTTTHRPATDLGFLLHKHPERVQRFPLPFGTAHVFYPEAGEERCTAALLVDVDPVGLVRRERGGFALAEYVNDRPYVASSLLSVALVTVFKTAMEGRRPESAAVPIPLEAALPAVRGDSALVARVFEPLGYAVEAAALGDSRFVSLRLRATVRLADLLTHLYVLLPVLDDEKHYWVDEDEVEKLRRRGGDWLPAHPERELIARRYLKHERKLYSRLLPEREPDEEDAALPLRDQRLGAVQAVLKASGARSVLDLGCGSGALLERLARDGYERITGADVSARALEQAARRLKLERRPDPRITLLQSPLTYRDRRLAGYDAAALVEVIEHVDPPRLEALESNVFGSAAPGCVVVTTPNAEYNPLWETLPAGARRHADHRFEWTRAEFAGWASRLAGAHGYSVRFESVGPEDPVAGPPTQMAVPTEVISSDACRALVADDANDQSATEDAFAVLTEIASRRLRRGRLTVVDATNVQREARANMLAIAREHDLFAVAIVLDTPEAVCVERNAARPDRDFGAHVVRRQRSQLKRSLRHLQREGFRRSFVLKGDEDVAIARAPMWTDRRAERGPFDIIGDVHGCDAELGSLLSRLGYVDGVHPDGRRAVFLGDLVDRGPSVPAVLRRVMAMVAAGNALCVPGNHDSKLARKLAGRDVQVTHGLAESLEQLEGERPEFVDSVREFLHGLVSHAVLDGGSLVVAHAGMLEHIRPTRPRVAAGARVRAVRRDHGGDRRARPARARGLGGGLPRHGRRRLRAHADRRAGVAQQHDQHRHWLRLRRAPDRAALAGARARVRGGGARALRAGPASGDG